MIQNRLPLVRRQLRRIGSAASTAAAIPCVDCFAASANATRVATWPAVFVRHVKVLVGGWTGSLAR